MPTDMCFDWPAPPVGYAQGDNLPAELLYPRVPTLVLSGDLDSVTSVTDAAKAASQFPNVVHLVIPNLTHITAFSNLGGNIGPAGVDYTNCVSEVVRNFVETLAPGDTACLAEVRPIRTVPMFVRKVNDAAPAIASPGNQGSATELRLAAAAAETVGDVVARFSIAYAGSGAGLRAGKFTVEPTSTGQSFTLTGVKWTNDLEVSGAMTWNLSTSLISAEVNLVKEGKSVGRLSISWKDAEIAADATLTGSINGKVVRAHRLAP
jgi:hypothetical protein